MEKWYGGELGKYKKKAKGRKIWRAEKFFMWRRAEIFNLRFAGAESEAETKAKLYSHGYIAIAIALRMSGEHAAYYDLHIFYAAPAAPKVLPTVGHPQPEAQTEHIL